MLIFQIALIILVALPIIVLAVYLWSLTVMFVRKKNKQDNPSKASRKRSGKK